MYLEYVGKNCPMGKSGQADITHYSINPLK